MFYNILFMSRLLFLVLIAWSIWACSASDTSAPEYAFYHWKTQVDIDEGQRAYLDSLSVQRLYLRLFDVKREGGQTVPVAMADVRKLPAEGGSLRELVPTVFIANAVLEQTPPSQIDSLAYRIAHKIRRIAEEQLDTLRFRVGNEVQMDCDWTLETGDKYFRLLQVLRGQFPELSATIRLHQIKYASKTGVPPVHRGVLMFYNMGKIEQPGEANSILNLPTAQAYLDNLELYPLELDLALPLFHWCVQFRNGRIVRILYGLPPELLPGHPLLRPLGQNRYEVLNSDHLGEHYVYAGDVLRSESVRPEQLRQALQMLQPHWRQTPRRLIFYHLDPELRARFPAQTLQTLRP